MKTVYLAVLTLAIFIAKPVSAEILRGVLVGVSDDDTIAVLTAENRSVRDVPVRVPLADAIVVMVR